MEKVVFLLWDPAARDKAANRDRLLGQAAPRLLDAGVHGLTVDVDDPEADVRSPAPKLRPGPRVAAAVSTWIDCADAREEPEAILREAGFDLGAYLVTESLYTEYGGNRHAPPRAWPDGERSPGVLALTVFEKPPRLDREQWLRRWYGRQSPVSEKMQPRTRYVRNAVARCLTAGKPRFDGIVEEAWPSARHVTNPFLFYGASNPAMLVRNMLTMLGSVKSFLDLTRLETTTMSEYILRSGPRIA